MSIRKLKHKSKYWRDDAKYGDQMHHFISRLKSKHPELNEVRHNDVD